MATCWRSPAAVLFLKWYASGHRLSAEIERAVFTNVSTELS
jgi:hypothetical protein